MPLSISIRFLTGRAHLHPWQTHHSEGRVEWPPSLWRFLRALVAIAGRGLTTLPLPDEGPSPKPAEIPALGMTKPKERGVTPEAKKKLSFSKAKQTLRLNEQLTDAEFAAWKAANPDDSFAKSLEQLRVLISTESPQVLVDTEGDEVPLSRLSQLLLALSGTPAIWLPKTAGGHTRQYFPIHKGGMVVNSGSAVFDTFATVRKDQPLVFHWPEVNLDQQHLADLKLILGRMTYFGRAESWCHADALAGGITKLPDMVTDGAGQTHWRCVCIEDVGKPEGKEYRDYTLERRLAPCKDVRAEVTVLLPRTKPIAEERPSEDAFGEFLKAESAGLVLLRCLLRESGQDIKDGLERPIGTRWVHYAAPRQIYNVPRPVPRPRRRDPEAVELVVYALNTATVHRPVLPALTDTLLVADRFRSAAMALCRLPSRSLSGHETDDAPCLDHDHAFWWPMDDDNDGFIDHVYVLARGGLQPNEVDALRRLNRLRQRGGRPDLLVTPVFVGRAADYRAWQGTTTTFVSATPYFCPLHLSHGRTGSGRIRPVSPVIRDSMRRQGIIGNANEVEITELVFDYDPETLPAPSIVSVSGVVAAPPRQYFPVVEPPANPAPLAQPYSSNSPAYPSPGVCSKDPDHQHPFGLSIGLFVSSGTRFIRALSFGRNRRGRNVRGYGRMLEIRFREPRSLRPFAIGSQCHFGLGLFVRAEMPSNIEGEVAALKSIADWQLKESDGGTTYG